MKLFEGIVEHGEALGRKLGFPTANLLLAGDLHDNDAEEGVWVALARCRRHRWIPATVSIGRRRTFFSEGAPLLLEAHLLDFQGDLYGAYMQVRLMKRIRSQERFRTAEALIHQMRQDVQITRRWAEMHHLLKACRSTNDAFSEVMV